jgi:VWFA-related protein
MLSVNGNFTLDQEAQQEALDPKLRELGDDPAGNSLRILAGVASRLAAIPGHKSLVWVTSDNALVDWKRMSVTMEKHSKHIEPMALRAQEAMNNAHVSVYPLDASRLEANVINPEIGNRNVELTPTFQMPLLNEHQMEGAEMRAGLDTNEYEQNRDMRPGRLASMMQQDMRPIMGVFREVAAATGGRAFPRSNNMVGELNGVVADGQATYVLSFTPSVPADGTYHLITIKLAGRKDASLRYRSGYQYDKEPVSLKDRFARVVREPADAAEIAVIARPVSDAAGQALRVTIAGADLDLTKVTPAQQRPGDPASTWAGKLDIFLVQRDGASDQAHVTGQTVGLNLKAQTYEHAMKEGLTFDARIKPNSDVDSLRVVVVDVNSGRIGSVTVPASAFVGVSN